ncbi:MAG: NAD(+) synthetase [Chloroflexi bacterium RBG_16_54_18]|nr:MAG: NAD(+) synthetase [Chloroflexi bacterium RBG_16_54_18]
MNHTSVDLTIDIALARTILVGFIRSEVTRAGFSKAILNLSGGVDSSLTAFLAAEALGSDNVMALRLPYQSSSPDSLDHAQMVIDATGIHSLTIPITEMVEPLFKRFPDSSQVRRGNVMARVRMLLLYDQSQVFGSLPVGTGNKTEILLGYTTVYGDAACAINPNGDLYKTQLRQLARAVGVPVAIVDKQPTADLWVGQTDEGELGFTYAEVDQLLFLLVDQRYSPQDCITAGFSENFVKAVLERVRRSQFKRLMPPIAKLSNRTVGYDFLYLRDWGT